MKAIIQYTGELVEARPNLYDVRLTSSPGVLFPVSLTLLQWDQFMRLGGELNTLEMEHRMSQAGPNQCATLVYTVRATCARLDFCLKETSTALFFGRVRWFVCEWCVVCFAAGRDNR